MYQHDRAVADEDSTSPPGAITGSTEKRTIRGAGVLIDDSDSELQADGRRTTLARATGLWLEAVVVVVLTAAVVVPVWPGVHTIDSQAILDSALKDRISNWYSPLHAWAWGVLDAAGSPPGTVLLLATAGLAVALLATYRLWLGRRAAIVATCVTVLWPPFYGMLGWVGRDNWFLVYLLTVVAAMGWSLRLPRYRLPLLVVAGLGAFAAADTRQNAVIVIPIVAAFAAATSTRWSGWRGVALVAFALVGGAGGFLALREVQAVVIDEHYYPEQHTYYYDLLGTSLKVGELLVPDELRLTDDLDAIAGVWSVSAAQLSQPVMVDDKLVFEPTVVVLDPYSDGGETTEVLSRAWRRMIVEHPVEYIQVRAGLQARQLGITAPARAVYYGSTDELGMRFSDDVRQNYPSLNEARLTWLDLTDGPSGAGEGSILHAPWIYLLAGLGGATAIAADRRFRPLGVAMLAMIAGMQATLLALAMSANYRYEFPTMVLSVVAAVGGTVVFRSSRRRSESDGPPADDDGPEGDDEQALDSADIPTASSLG